METRKIQRTGGSSFIVTLPKKWIKKHGLKEQDHVNLLFNQSGAITLQPHLPQKKQDKICIDNLTKDEIKREIIALYIMGAEEIKVFGKEMIKNGRPAVRTALEILIGYEIIEETTSNILLKNIFNIKKFSFKQNLEKMFIMSQFMLRDSINSFLDNKKVLARDVAARDIEIDKLYFLILRQTQSLLQNKISEQDLTLSLVEVHFYKDIATQIERIADHAIKIAQITLTSNISPSVQFNKLFQAITKEILVLLQETASFIEIVDKNKAHKILNKTFKLKKDLDLLQEEIIKINFIEGIIIVDSIDRIQGYIMNIGEIFIDQAVLEN